MHLAVPYVTCSFSILGPVGRENLKGIAMLMRVALGKGIGTGCTARDNLDIGLAGEQGIAFRPE